ncbi:7TM GPCR protein [Aphelenchoides avenae]|nr:7TM GPCR protein [Aphelenchus avenae]
MTHDYSLSRSYQTNENVAVTTRLVLPLGICNSIQYIIFLGLSAFIRSSISPSMSFSRAIAAFEWVGVTIPIQMVVSLVIFLQSAKRHRKIVPVVAKEDESDLYFQFFRQQFHSAGRPLRVNDEHETTRRRGHATELPTSARFNGALTAPRLTGSFTTRVSFSYRSGNMLDVKEIHHVVDTVKSSASLAMNVVLLYIILRHSSLQLTAYKRIFLMTCITDILLSLAVLISQPAMFFTAEGYMILICNGFIANRSKLVDHMSLSFYCMLLHTNITCVVLQFVLRYIMVCAKGSMHAGKAKKYIILFTIFWCLVQSQIAVWTFALGSTEETQKVGLRYLDKFGWTYDNASVPYPASSRGLKTQLHHGFYTVSCMGGYFVIVWCQIEIWHHLKSHGTAIHASTRRMHNEVNRALISLAVAPLLTLIGPLFIFLYYIFTSTDSGISSALITIMVSAITFVNPLTTVYFVKQYRHALLRILGMDNARVHSDPKLYAATAFSGMSLPTAQ